MARVRSGATAGWTARTSLGLVSRASERTEHNILWPPLNFVFCFPHTCPVFWSTRERKKQKGGTRRFKRCGGEKGGAGAGPWACAKSTFRSWDSPVVGVWSGEWRVENRE